MLSAFLLAASAKLADPLMTFSRSPSRNPHRVTVEVGLLRPGGRSDYWFKRSVVQQESKSVWWTDTVRCPAARSVLIEALKLEMPSVSVAGLENDQIIITADGVAYQLKGEAEYEGKSAYDFEIQSNSGTPLARWIDDSLRALESCWSKDSPNAG